MFKLTSIVMAVCTIFVCAMAESLYAPVAWAKDTVAPSVASHAHGSEESYSQGHTAAAFVELKNELRNPKIDDAAIENKLNLVLELYVSDPSLSLKDILGIYDLAEKAKPSSFLRKRIASERKALRESSTATKSIDEGLKALELAEKQSPSAQTYNHERRAQLVVLSTQFGRAFTLHPKEWDWLYLRGRAAEDLSQAGKVFLNSYLSHVANDAKFRASALDLLKRHDSEQSSQE
jgi:hypothetical protein